MLQGGDRQEVFSILKSKEQKTKKMLLFPLLATFFLLASGPVGEAAEQSKLLSE
ncbi:UNVERIFIED_CONTAM: hypothetical protein K2H54_039061, partial [Gekko kuhli]